MVMGFRERRLGCRLYVDRQSDANILKKLDRMLVDGSFPNQTELIKRGIELAYEEVYGEESVRSSGMSDVDIRKLAGEIVGALKPEIKKLLVEYEARVATMGTPAPPKPVLASTHDVPQDNMASVADDEAILPNQTFNFLKGLNDD